MNYNAFHVASVSLAQGQFRQTPQSSSWTNSAFVWFSPFLYSREQSRKMIRGLYQWKIQRHGASHQQGQWQMFIQPPAYSSYVRLSSTIDFVVGCARSNSWRIAFLSLVTTIPPPASSSVFNRDCGPKVVRIMAATVLEAWILACCILLPVSRFKEFLRTSTGAWIFSKHPNPDCQSECNIQHLKKIRKQERWGENRTCMQTLKSIPSRKISRRKSLGGIRKKRHGYKL